MSGSGRRDKEPRPLGSKAKLRAHFLSNVGRTLDSTELRQVAGSSEWARRLRELRDEEGFRILSDKDRSDLKPGQYVMESPTPVPAFARGISKETRAFVLDRNGFTCQMCGAAAGDPQPNSFKKTRLHIGHIVDKSQGGTDDRSNLRAICSTCNEGLQNSSLMRPDRVWLLAQVRRARVDDQMAVYEWLATKFGHTDSKPGSN